MILSEEELDRALDALHADVRTDETRLAADRATLLAAAERPVVAAIPKRSSRRLLVAAAVFGLVAGGLVVQAVSIGDQTTGGYAEAAGLDEVADRIRSADPPVGPGQYRYIVQRGWTATKGPKGESWRYEEVTEIWVPADETQHWLRRVTKTGRVMHSPRPGVEPTPIAPVRPQTSQWRVKCGDLSLGKLGKAPCARAGNWSDPTPAWIAGLPRNPQALHKQLHSDAPSAFGDLHDVAMLQRAADALSSGLLPADLRAALYRALALMPELKVTDRAANLDGRVGVAYGIEYTHPKKGHFTRNDIIVDTRTGQFIGARSTSIKNGPWEFTTSMSTAVVDRMGARP